MVTHSCGTTFLNAASTCSITLWVASTLVPTGNSTSICICPVSCSDMNSVGMKGISSRLTSSREVELITTFQGCSSVQPIRSLYELSTRSSARSKAL